jgi:hypothetical protein
VSFQFYKACRLIMALFCGAGISVNLGAVVDVPRDPRAVDLGGDWEFRLDPMDVGRDRKWFETAEPFERVIRVPGSWNAQGMAFESES